MVVFEVVVSELAVSEKKGQQASRYGPPDKGTGFGTSESGSSMSRYPHTRLFTDPHRSVVLSGPHIQVLDTQTGQILHSTTKLTAQDRDAVIKSGPIRCSALSSDGRYLATAGDDKRLTIWDLESFILMNARDLPKKPTSIVFTKTADILVSDKFGDVFKYTLDPSVAQVGEKMTSDALASHENPSGGELVLGHASLLTSCLLTPDEQFVITADRDEHIRVSWYPEGYTIESYCLGHKKYVSAIHIPAFSPENLISGGGDLELKVWDWMTGRLQRNINVFTSVEPFIQVKARKRRRDFEEDEHEGEEAAKGKGRRRHKGKRKQQNADSEEPEGPESVKPVEDPAQTLDTAITVFVVRRIGSFVSGRENHVIFNAAGATAIFYFIFPENDNQPEIRHYDFGRPVIDFSVREDGMIFALLDADYPGEYDATKESNESDRRLVRAIQWSTDKFIEVETSALLLSLNTMCSLPAAGEDLKALELYSDLSSLPKVVDVDAESQVPEQAESLQGPGDEVVQGVSATAGMTKRALGRLKHKRALERLQHDPPESPGAPGPDNKRVKADTDSEDEGNNDEMELT